MLKDNKINIVFFHHPNSENLIKLKDFRSRRANIIHINCGLTNSYKNGLRESDFFPGYASYNSILFESSCILTIWEHMHDLFDDSPVMILHTDVISRFRISHVLDYLEQFKKFAIGLTIPSYKSDDYKELEITDVDQYRCSVDPWRLMKFDVIVDIWGLIRVIDKEAWEFAMDTNPVMIYSHQFAASKDVFDNLGYKLCQMVAQLRLGQCGLWTPHVFERIISIRLAMEVDPKILAAFSHKSSSGPKGDGTLTLYGPRPHKYLRLRSRIMDQQPIS